MNNLFVFRENTHNLRNFQIMLNKNNSNNNKKTVRSGSAAIFYRTTLPWANLPEEYKHANSLSEFKLKKKAWKYDTCVFRLCRLFLQNLGFI